MTPQQQQRKRAMTWLADQSHPNAGTILAEIAALEDRLAEAERNAASLELDLDKAVAWKNLAEEEIAGLREELATVEGSLAEAEAVIAKLPRTADGVAVVPGDLVWHPEHIGKRPSVVIAAEEGTDMAGCFVVYTKAIGRDGFVSQTGDAPVSDCYSTPEAAKEARDAT